MQNVIWVKIAINFFLADCEKLLHNWLPKMIQKTPIQSELPVEMITDPQQGRTEFVIS